MISFVIHPSFLILSSPLIFYIDHPQSCHLPLTHPSLIYCIVITILLLFIPSFFCTANHSLHLSTSLVLLIHPPHIYTLVPPFTTSTFQTYAIPTVVPNSSLIFLLIFQHTHSLTNTCPFTLTISTHLLSPFPHSLLPTLYHEALP